MSDLEPDRGPDETQPKPQPLLGAVAGFLAGFLAGALTGRDPTHAVYGAGAGAVTGLLAANWSNRNVFRWQTSTAALVCLGVTVVCEVWCLIVFHRSGSQAQYYSRATNLD